MLTPSAVRSTTIAGALLSGVDRDVCTRRLRTGKAGSLPDFTDLYEKAGPTVVSIDVTQKSRRTRGMPELSEDDPFYEFFRRFGQVPPRRGPEREPEAQAVVRLHYGSDGQVITNAHVVDGADEVTVRLSTRREFRAKVLGADKRTDIALLKIEARICRRSRSATRTSFVWANGSSPSASRSPREHDDGRYRQRQGA